MMAKIVKRMTSRVRWDYIIDKKKDTQIVASEGLFMENPETIAMSFNAQSRIKLWQGGDKTCRTYRVELFQKR
ncbi:hypothetical protein NXX56_29300 [Bacteroides thetaiotaomicron]|nr:hypothetical protein [Bacteroides thetaiotaomicron]